MPTVIDELIVELKLDPKGFDEGQKKAVSDLRRFEKEATNSSKKVATSTDTMTQAFGLLQGRLLAIAGLITGGMGLSSFIDHITKLTAHTGYLATSLGVTSKELGKWESAGASVGASAGEIAAGFAAIQKSMASMQLTGQSALHAFAQATHQAGQGPAVELYNPDGSWRSPTDILVGTSRWAQAQPNKAVASQMLSQTGMSQGMINMLLLGPEELKKRLKEYEKFAPSTEDTKRFQDLQQAIAKTSASAEKLGRSIVALFSPGLIKFMESLTRIVEAFQGKGAIAGLKTLNDEASAGVGEGVNAVVGAAKDADQTIGKATTSGGIWNRVKSWWTGKPVEEPTTNPNIQWHNPFAKKDAATVPPSGDGPQGDGSSQPTSEETPAKKSGAVPTTGWWTPERKQQSVDYLVKHADLPEVSARAMVARWAGVESTQKGASEVNSIGAQGIAQWLGPRQNGYKLGDLDSQLAKVVRELKGEDPTSRKAYRTLMGATNAREAAIGASQYERAEGYNGTYDNFVGKTMRHMPDIPGGDPRLVAERNERAKNLPIVNGNPVQSGEGVANFMRGPLPGNDELVTVKTEGGKSVRVNKQSAPYFLGFLNDLEKAGAPINSIGGHNVRPIAGSNKWSQHAYGNAIDVNMTGRNVTTGGLKKWADDNPEKLAEIEKRYGMVSGAKWRNPDFGHWEWGGAMRGLQLGARGAMMRGGPTTTTTNSNNRSHQTTIGDIHVTAPPGADAVGYGSSIKQELMRNDNVMNSNTGLL